MSPLASVLLYASRYAHGRQTGAYVETIQGCRAAWPLLSPRDRAYLLTLWREQLAGNLRGEEPHVVAERKAWDALLVEFGDGA